MKQLNRLLAKTKTSEESPSDKIRKLLTAKKVGDKVMSEDIEESPEHEAGETEAEEYIEELLAGKAKKKSGIKFRSASGGQKNQDLQKFGAGNSKGPIA